MARSTSSPDRHRVHAVRREREGVTPLELFFDLVFVLALTQCTALLAAEPTWRGLAKGLIVLCVLWWSWVGYAWLTSVVDPEEGAVRIVVFAAMAALLVAALCVPTVFDDLGLTFAIAYGVVRVAHIALFTLASRDDPALRRSTMGLAIGTGLGVGLLIGASFLDGPAQGALWVLAIVLDMGEPYVFGAEGWKLAPAHFAERHGLIIIIALGESIVAIGVGAAGDVSTGVVVAAALGVALAATMWWAYFDVVALAAERALADKPEGKARNELARDSYSYLHFPMVAGIVAVALGLKTTLAHVSDPLGAVPGAALAGGVAVYLLAHVAFRLRNIATLNRPRLVVAVVLLAAIPLVADVDALVALAGVTAVMIGLIAYETIRYADARHDLRHELLHAPEG